MKFMPIDDCQTDGTKNTVTPHDAAASASQLQPRFVRLPKPGKLCPFTGLSRTQIYLMCKSGKVQSHSLKRRGTCRGVRLIDYQSLISAIQEFASAEEQEAKN